MHYCIQGLLKCPTVAPGTLAWRARPEKLEELRKVYRLGAEVIYCGFTSTTLDFKVACQNANYAAGTVLEMTLLEGYQLDNVSVYPRESEVLLLPNKRFAVTSAPVTKRVCGLKGEGGPPKQKRKDPSPFFCPALWGTPRQPPAGLPRDARQPAWLVARSSHPPPQPPKRDKRLLSSDNDGSAELPPPFG